MYSRADRLGRNDPCWCGSGQKYKKCHLSRESQEPLQPGRLRHEMGKEFRKGRCLHPAASKQSCGKVIDAHTLQRSSTLGRLADESGHVLSFYPSDADENGHFKLQRVGWNVASTFRGFCDKHDSTLFVDLEKRPFVSDPKQCFLVGYRALVHELHQKSAAARARPILYDLERGLPMTNQMALRHYLNVSQEGNNKGISDLRHMKKLYDAAWKANDYSRIHSLIVTFEGNLDVASTGLVHPNFDTEGLALQDIARAKLAEGLAIGVVATDTGGAVVFSWPVEYKVPRNFAESLASLDDDNLCGYIVEFMFYYIENTYFSPSWWEVLSSEQRNRLRSLAEVANAYYSGSLAKNVRPYTSWRSISRQWWFGTSMSTAINAALTRRG